MKKEKQSFYFSPVSFFLLLYCISHKMKSKDKHFININCALYTSLFKVTVFSSLFLSVLMFVIILNVDYDKFWKREIHKFMFL